jgi:multidrug efflux pump subunit AcrB
VSLEKNLLISNIGGEKMVKQNQASGGSLIGFAIIILILFLLFPAFTAWLIWILIIFMLIMGIIGLIAGGD